MKAKDVENANNGLYRLINDSTGWLQEKAMLCEVGHGWVQVTTPYLDRHHDYLQFYMRKEGAGYVLTDDGYIINDLIASGYNLDTSKVQEILIGFGVQMDGEQLLVESTPDDLSIKMQNFIQALLTLNRLN